ncbi:hypothetical protein ACN4EG_26470, partial [Alkalinema pantanalense CENA528]|uniref:hypothetical protein n=1 Tax=Alkalinema pantanalense TaxID=1620705 RepID=UPI003D6E5B56
IQMGTWSHDGSTGCVVTSSLNQTPTPVPLSFYSSILLSVKQLDALHAQKKRLSKSLPAAMIM